MEDDDDLDDESLGAGADAEGEAEGAGAGAGAGAEGEGEDEVEAEVVADGPDSPAPPLPERDDRPHVSADSRLPVPPAKELVDDGDMDEVVIPGILHADELPKLEDRSPFPLQMDMCVEKGLDYDVVDDESSSPPRKKVVRQPQIKKADELFEKIANQIDLTRFDRMELRVHVPNLNSLYYQTIQRLDQFVGEYRNSYNSHFFQSSKGPGGEAAWSEDVVIKNNDSPASLETKEQLKSDIEANENVLYLVVVDEAHYEATKMTDTGGSMDRFINDEVVRTSSNVVTLCVSATPYNLLTIDSQIPESNVVTWQAQKRSKASLEAVRDSLEVDPDPDYAYYGLSWFQQNLADKSTDQAAIYGGSLAEADAQFQHKLELEKKAMRKTSIDQKAKPKKGAVNQAALIKTMVDE
jgi:hypothetical protein